MQLKNKRRWLACALLILGISLFFMSRTPVFATTGTPALISFEGKIVKSDGTNIADGTYNMEFKIYSGTSNVGTGDTLLFTEDWLVGSSQGGVAFTSGTYAKNIGSAGVGTGDSVALSSLNFNQYPLWISVQIGNTSSCTITTTFQSNCGGDGEMTPYIQFTSAPYAMNAGQLGGIAATGFVQLSPGSQQTGTINVSGGITSGTSTFNSTNLNFGAAGTVQSASGSSMTVQSQGTGQLILNSAGGSGLALQVAGTTNALLSSGSLAFQQATTENIASAATGTQLTIQGGAATSGTNVGGNLLLQGGSGASTGASGSVIVKSNTNNSTIAFQVQNASGVTLLDADTFENAVTVTGNAVINSSGSFPTTSVLDNFNRANGALGSNWTGPSDGNAFSMVINSNATTSGGAGFGDSSWTAPIAAPNIEEYATINTLPAANDTVGVSMLSSPTASLPTGYTIVVTNTSPTTTWNIKRIDASGAHPILATTTQAVSAGDSMGLSRIGNQLIAWYKPVAGSWTQILTATDSSYNTAGYYIGLWSQDTTAQLDNFGGGTGTLGIGLTVNGNQLIQSSVNNATAFQVQNTAGTNSLAVDTTNQEVIVGSGTSGTISSGGEWDQHGTNQATDAVSPHAMGNVEVLGIDINNTNITVTGVSGGGALSWRRLTYMNDATHRVELWIGQVTSTGASTITATYSSTPGSFTELAAQEFTASLGSNTVWQVDTAGTNNVASSTTITYPTLTASVTSEMYWGYAQISATPSAGSTTGFSYITTSAGGANEIAYNPALGIGSVTPTATQSPAGVTNAVAVILRAGVNALNINGSTTATGQLLLSNTSTTAFQVQSASGTTVLNVDTTTNTLTVKSVVINGTLTINGHIITGGATPTIAAGAGAGTGPTVSISGNDTSGKITVTTGTAPSAGLLATITFGSAYGAAPKVTLEPDSLSAALLQHYVGSTTTTFTLSTANSPSASTTYSYFYHAEQ